ncbi:hypothetical protein O181_027645 [Austropuccinia psidii MF-1]|uniref:Uncharacterized protein n=1 Tax=Austropuccinia psidii MF-1 TaxID=1389203 RepID=A0A9Q3H3E8_9BASI|nr:hypothetical protein [Austropuccinia psidii MF-1]
MNPHIMLTDGTNKLCPIKVSQSPLEKLPEHGDNVQGQMLLTMAPVGPRTIIVKDDFFLLESITVFPVMDYKAKKESFVSNGQGGGSLELLVISFKLMLTIFLWRLIQNLSGHQKHLAISLLIEFLILIFPILAFTTFSANKLWLPAILLSSITLIILVKFHAAICPSTIKPNHHPSYQDFQPQTSDGQSSNN